MFPAGSPWLPPVDCGTLNLQPLHLTDYASPLPLVFLKELVSNVFLEALGQLAGTWIQSVLSSESIDVQLPDGAWCSGDTIVPSGLGRRLTQGWVRSEKVPGGTSSSSLDSSGP